MESLKDVSAKIVENDTKGVKSFIDGIYKDLVEDAPISSIPEFVFKEYFLEYFRSGGLLETDTPLINKWVELAGGPYNEVNVVDKQGNTLYTVPGLYCRPAVGENLSNVNFSNIVSEFNLRSNRIHSDGINFLTGALSGMDGGISTEYQEYLIKWNTILSQYDDGNENKKIAKPVESTDFLDFG